MPGGVVNALVALRWTTLGDTMGSLLYMGSCPCGVQHMSTHARIALRRNANGSVDRLCENCGRKAEKAG